MYNSPDLVTRVVAFDLETYLIAPGLTTPPAVCVSWASLELPECEYSPPGALPAAVGPWAPVIAQAIADTTRDPAPGESWLEGPGEAGREGYRLRWALEGAEHLPRLLAEWLADPRTLVVGHNVAFDLLVAEAEAPWLGDFVRRALAEGRVHCTLVRDQLVDIAAGQFRSREETDPETGEVVFRSIGYTLSDLAQRRLGMPPLAKGADGYRLRYGELAATPLADWPLEAIRYAQLDALVTLGVWVAQVADWHPMTDEVRQTCASWALARVAGRGLCVDPAAVEALNTSLVADVVAARESLAGAGIFRPDGTKDTKRLSELVEAAWTAKGLAAPRTPTGGVATSRQVLLDSGDPTLAALAAVGARERLLTGFVPALRGGYSAPIVARYHTLVESGRTSCVRPNVQQLPRWPGVRDCFVPREGYLFCSVDYDTLELRTLAQVCLEVVGYSRMAELLRTDPHYDLHAHLAAGLLGNCTYEQLREALASPDPATRKPAKAARQRSKPVNFGFPGGLGTRKFREYSRTTYGVEFTEAEAAEARRAWAASWPEVPDYQRQVAAVVGELGEATMALVRTGFVRGGVGYTQGCNFQFQGLAAAGAKAALWRVALEGPAHGVFPVAFLHDEILAEVPEATAHESAEWLALCMVEAMTTVVPDVPICATPALMRRWYKDAEAVRDPSGRLVPWAPPAPALPTTPTPTTPAP